MFEIAFPIAVVYVLIECRKGTLLRNTLNYFATPPSLEANALYPNPTELFGMFLVQLTIAVLEGLFVGGIIELIWSL